MTAGVSVGRTTDASLDRAARGSIINLLGAAVSAVANFALTVTVARLVAQDEAGVFFAATSLFLLTVAVGQLGTNTGLVFFISGARARGELRHAQSYMRVAAVPVLVASALLAIGVFLAAEPLGQLLSPGRESEFATYMRVMAFFVPCAAIVNLGVSGTQGLGTMRAFAALDHVSKPVLQLVLVGIALAVMGPGSAAWAWSVAYLPVAVLAWLWWRRLRDRAAPQMRDPQLQPAGRFWRFTSPRAFANVTQVAMQRLDIILVGALAGLVDAAIYAAATRFLVIGQMIGRAVATSGQPLLGESLARGDRGSVQQLYRVTTAWIVLATWPWYLTLMLSSSVLLQAFGGNYRIGSGALVVLGGTMLFATSCGMVDQVLNMAGRSVLNLVNVITAFTVFVGLDLLLIPSLGFLGAAIGWSAAIAVANLLPLLQVWSTERVNPYGRPLVIAMLASVVPFGVVPAGLALIVGSSLVSTLAGLALGSALFALVLWRFRDSVHLPTLLEAVRRRRGRRTASRSA